MAFTMAAMSLWMDRWKSSRPGGRRQNGEAERGYGARYTEVCVPALPPNSMDQCRANHRFVGHSVSSSIKIGTLVSISQDI